MRILFITIFSIALSLQLVSCSGEECAATSDFIEDIDSDCVDDTGDNCVGVYNPNQLDSDDDGIGNACSSISVAPGISADVSEMIVSRAEGSPLSGEQDLKLPNDNNTHGTYEKTFGDCKSNLDLLEISSHDNDLLITSSSGTTVATENEFTIEFTPDQNNGQSCFILQDDSMLYLRCTDKLSDCVTVYEKIEN